MMSETVTGSFIEIPHNGKSLRAYYAAPNDVDGQTPSVVLAMHLWGIDKPMRDAAHRFAQAGFAVVIPDLYDGWGAPDGDAQADHKLFIPFAQRLSFESVDPPIRAAAAFLKEQFPQTSTAIAGFCMGGTMALRRSQGYGDVFAASAVWYGNIAGVNGQDIDIPIICSFGAADHGIPIEKVKAFEGALQVRHDVRVYAEAGHAFCDAERPSYDARAAEDSWTRTIAFLRNACRR